MFRRTRVGSAEHGPDRRVYRVVMPYVVTASLWILFSDLLLDLAVRDPAARTWFSVYKGWGFVLVTALLLAVLVRSEAQRQAQVETELRAESERLAASERKYRELVEHAQAIILHWSRDGRVLFMNPYGLRFFGYTEEEILGRHLVGTIVPPSETGGRDLAALIEQIAANPSAFEENVNENMRRNGERVWVSWTNRNLLNDRGEVEAILSIGTDITERLRAEKAIRELNASLERRVAERTAELAVALQRAEEADRLKSAFLATMSHELRTPLNSIIGFTGILLQGLAGPLNEEQTKQLGMVRDSARHLLLLINDVLDLSKIEAGELEVHLEPFDVPSLISRVVRTVEPLAAKKRLRLTAQVTPEVDVLTSDRRRVEQVLLNLLGNAIKFTEQGQVELSCRVQGDQMLFSVRDTGIGLRPRDLERIFQPFYQADAGLTRQHEGSGLGLAICRRLAERLGGSVSVESEWGKGSTFTFALPMVGEVT
ncbi:MAG: ATP-binding protein, partial [Armatimonadota bacterium]|nr:ATP-binding protein [Armatimonadota bacterium]